MLDSLLQRSQESSWQNTETLVQDAQKLDLLEDGTFSHVFCTFVINFTEDPQKAIAEMHRVLRPDVSWVPCWEAAVRQVSGDASYTAPALFHEGTTELRWMEDAARKAGLSSVNVQTGRCLHSEQAVESAVETFYGMGNPSIKLLMKGYDKNFIKATRGPFKNAYEDRWGSKRQYEVAITMVAREAA
ncbi:hypothetical protein LTR85_005207 [Meristemomyces frigidus]|nr:hypothetical protein LTR85_005207 [Meristemomyces frigidus]